MQQEFSQTGTAILSPAQQQQINNRAAAAAAAEEARLQQVKKVREYIVTRLMAKYTYRENNMKVGFRLRNPLLIPDSNFVLLDSFQDNIYRRRSETFDTLMLGYPCSTPSVPSALNNHQLPSANLFGSSLNNNGNGLGAPQHRLVLGPPPSSRSILPERQPSAISEANSSSVLHSTLRMYEHS